MTTMAELQPVGTPSWMVTYADLMSLLLAPFVMLISMNSSSEEQRTHAAVEAIQKRFGAQDSGFRLIPGADHPGSSAVARLTSIGRTRRAETFNSGQQLLAFGGEGFQGAGLPAVEHATIGASLLFRGSASELTDQQQRMLEEAAREIGGKRQKIEIRARASGRSTAPGANYPTRWDLAYARCFNTMEYLVDQGIDPRRIRIAVAAESEPAHMAATAISSAAAAESSRVEVFMLNEPIKQRERTADDKPNKNSDQHRPY